MADWVSWFIALIQTTIQWLAAQRVLGVSVLWIIVASMLLALLVRTLLYRP